MRLKLQARTELTLKTLRALSDQRRWHGAARGEQTDSSAAYMARIVAPLTHAGWVTSVPGPPPVGVNWSSNLKEVSLHDLIELVEGSTDDCRCVPEVC